MLKTCRQCIYPETKPNLWFDDTGLCSACIAFEKRKEINWPARRDEFRSKFPPGTRVIAAVSGGKDSHYIVIKLLEYEFDVLAVCATTDDLTPIGRRNLDNIARMVDLVEVTPDKERRRKMSRYALETVGDISWCEHVLIWSVPYRVAIDKGINYVFYGENPQNEYGSGPPESQDLAGMPPQWEHEFGGMLGLRVSDMQQEFGHYGFELYQKPVCGWTPERVFLGYYFPWNGEKNAHIARDHGFEWWHQNVETSCVPWENLDNHQTGIHDYLRYVKYGYTRAHDILGSQIRRGNTNRVTAMNFIDRMDPFPGTYIGKRYEDILADIGMTRERFADVIRHFTNHEIFPQPLEVA